VLAQSFITFLDFWDTAGQERFDSLHPSYYYAAHACILVSITIQAVFLYRRAWLMCAVLQVFDITRKVTYTNLSKWYAELQENRPSIPCIVVANKIDRTLLTASLVPHHQTVFFPVDLKATKKSFNFASKRQACACCSHRLHAVTLICSSHLHS
jgi:Rab-like protein 2